METQKTNTPLHLEDLKRKEKVSGKVVKITLAGAFVDIGLEMPGLVHISQLQKEPVNRVEDVVQVGQTVDVWVRRVFPKKGRIELTMIEPLPLEWREIKEGMVVKGKVTRLEKYGAFVDIGAERPGLVHISELSHEYIRTPGDAISEGDEVEVKIIKVNRRRRQIKLSVKALLEKPSKAPVPEKKARNEYPKKEEEEETEEEIPTAMEIALRDAMERNHNDVDKSEKINKKSSPVNNELENILSRTLEHKVQTAAK
ncbi:MAG TPA: S1 RNA-binding domain-containing protein [Anaerolineae bacterium]|nr:S1 RNA-binding domain-containing protein [Anaerolineae bacterium]